MKTSSWRGKIVRRMKMEIRSIRSITIMITTRNCYRLIHKSKSTRHGEKRIWIIRRRSWFGRWRWWWRIGRFMWIIKGILGKIKADPADTPTTRVDAILTHGELFITFHVTISTSEASWAGSWPLNTSWSRGMFSSSHALRSAFTHAINRGGIYYGDE